MDRQLEARKAATDRYDEAWPMRTTIGNLAREGFLAGWDAAMEYVKGRNQVKCEEDQGYPHFHDGGMPLG